MNRKEGHMRLIDRIDEALLKAGKSRGDLAAALGLSTQAISNLKRRPRSTLRPENVARAARWLRCDIYWLCTGEGKYAPDGARTEQFSFIATEVARWLDAMPDDERARVFTLLYEVMKRGTSLPKSGSPVVGLMADGS